VDCRQVEVEQLADALNTPCGGVRVLEVKADRSTLRRLHASIKAAI
jgi:2-succinyl-5-enolpyruvyl-6-hydroxy-3-cyclohexene-1-carboxylate synthase